MTKLFKNFVSFYMCLVAIVSGGDYKQNTFKERINVALNVNERPKNVIKVLGLDVNGYKKEDSDKLCELIDKQQPSLIALQQVSVQELLNLKKCFQSIKKCSLPKRGELRKRHTNGNTKRYKKCGGYEITGAGSSSSEETTFFNPIIFRERRKLRKLDSNGTFWLSEIPDEAFTKIDGADGFHICSWAKLRFAVDIREKEPVIDNAFFETLYEVLRDRKKRRMKWVDFFFVNTQLDNNIDVALKQLRILLNHLNRNILPDSEIPVVLTGGSNTDDLPELYELLKDKGFKNAITNARNVDDARRERRTFLWHKNFVSLVSIQSYGDLESQLSALLFQ